MMKYELALVLSAKIEDEERAAMVEKVQAMITTDDGAPGAGGPAGHGPPAW